MTTHDLLKTVTIKAPLAEEGGEQPAPHGHGAPLVRYGGEQPAPHRPASQYTWPPSRSSGNNVELADECAEVARRCAVAINRDGQSNDEMKVRLLLRQARNLLSEAAKIIESGQS